MALLSFQVESNYQEVVRLRQEIDRLQSQLKSFGPGTSVSTIRSLEYQLKSAKTQLNSLVHEAATAGAQLELNIRKGANGAINAINDLQSKLANPIQGVAQIAGLAGLGAFLGNITKIRGQFQLMETNINTLLGSAEKGKAMMEQLTEYAKVSPLDFQGTVGAAQMMLGFGIEQEKILPFMKALGDVSMGDAQRFQSLTLAFSQMSAAGKLMGQDLMQMVNAGFQPLDQLAKDTGKSIGQLKEEMSQGKISAEMVQQAFINATSEGGKFYNMSQAATATISGQMSMLGDATDLMFNDLGKHAEGAIIKVIEGATWLVENYEKVGGVLGTAVAAFGIYKASALASEFAVKAAAEDRARAVVEGFSEEIAKMEEYNRQRALMAFDEDVRGALESGSISSDMAEKIQMLREEVSARKEAAEAAVEAAQAEVQAASDGLQAAKEKLDNAQELVDTAEQIGDANDKAAAAEELLSAQMEVEASTASLCNAQTNLNTAEKELNTATTQANAVAQIQQTNATNANTTSTNLNTAATGKGRIATALSTAADKAATIGKWALTTATNAAKNAWNGLKVAFATNPFGLIITALTTVVGLFMTFKSEAEQTTSEVDRFGESAVKTKRNIDTLYAVLDSVSKESNVYRDALDELTKIAQEYGIVIDEEKDTLDQLIEKRQILNDLILKEGEARQIANRIATYEKDKEGYVDEFIKDMTSMIEDESNGQAEENAGRYAQMIADKVERDLQDKTNGTIQGLVAHWNKLEADLKKLESNIEYDDYGNVSSDYYPKMEQLRKEIADVQTEIAQAANEEAKAFADQMGMAKDYKLDIKDTAKFVKELTDKVTTTNQFIEQTKLNAQAVNDELEAMKFEGPDFSAAGMDVTNLVKNFKDFQKQLEDVNDTEVKPSVDSSEIDAATESATDAQTEVDNLDASSATPTTDTGQIDSATASAMTATNAMNTLDATSAEPVIKTTWLDGFMSKINDAWIGLQKFLGVENPTSIVSTKTSTPPKKTKAQKAKQAVSDIKTEFSNQVKNAKTTNQKNELRKGIKEVMGDLDQNGSDYKYFQGLLDTLDKNDKSKSSGKSGKGKSGKGKSGKGKGKGSQDDPKQRAYEAQKALDDEAKRQAELAQEERNRQRELEIAQMEDNSAKEIATIELEGEKKRQALEKELQQEADILEKNALQQWLKGAKGRKEYQYYAQFSAEQLAAMREEYRKQAKENIGFITQSQILANEEAADLQRIYRADAQTMRNYLKEFGTFHQKKLAIAQDYAEKIRNAQNTGERLMLEGQRDRELKSLEGDAISQRINWYSVFDNVGVVMKGQLEPLYKELQAYVKTDAFRQSGAENQQTVINAMEKIRGQLGESQSWRDLSASLTDYQEALNQLRIATENDAAVNAELSRLMAAQQTADQNLAKARTNPEATAEQIKGFEDALAAANKELEDYGATVVKNGEALQIAQNAVQSSGTMLSMTAKNVMQPISEIYTFLSGAGLQQIAELWGAFDQLKGGIEGLKAFKNISDSAKDMADGAAEAGETLAKELPDEIINGLGKAGLIAQIISSVLKILDILKEGVSTLITAVIDSIFNAISGILDDVLSGDIVIKIGKSLYEGIVGIFKSILTMGGLFDWLGSDSDKNLERDLELLTASNDALRRSIDDLADEMRDAKTSEMGSVYQQQKSNLEQAMANTQEMMQRSGAAKKNGFLGIGSKASSNKKIDEGMSKSDWERISRAAGVSVNSASDFWKLTSEQMAKVAKDAPDLYGKIKKYADDGYKDAAQFMDEYIEFYKELEELQKAFKESLTTTTFEGVRDEFKSVLLDMESDSQDFANNFEKMMQNAVVNSLMNAKYNQRIQKWYDDFASFMNDENGLTATEQNRLKQEWDGIVNDAISERDAIRKTMGWGANSQQSSSRSLEGLSQDTGNAIEGRLTAIQLSTEQIRMGGFQQGLTMSDINDGLVDLIQEYSLFNTHFDNLERQIARIGLDVTGIRENTDAMVQPIIEMQASLSRIESHTKRL